VNEDLKNILVSFQSTFYCYYAASKEFRRQVVDTIGRLKLQRPRNQILPISFDLRTFPAQRQPVHRKNVKITVATF